MAEVRLADLTRSSIHYRDGSIALQSLRTGTCLSGGPIAGRSVLVATGPQSLAAMAMIECDGCARRMTIVPPALPPDHMAAMIEDAEVDTIVTDRPDHHAGSALDIVEIGTAIRPREMPVARDVETEWVLLTSGTSGRPKMVAHSLAALTGAIAPKASRDVWATFYDIRRYGGLQILLRALVGGCDLVLSNEGETTDDHLRRLGAAGVTAISGTPSHWRRVLMSTDRSAMAPAYVRLSGEIADQIVLNGLHAAYPDASIGHAFASTEAGVAFAVDDGLEGFPAGLVETPSASVSMKVEDGSLRIKSTRSASHYLGTNAPKLADADGFIDTGDLVERRDDRWHFVGRRAGIINVGGLKVNPEEVETAINGHELVRMSLVTSKKSPFTGSIVVADVVLQPCVSGDDAIEMAILDDCRLRLQPHKVPALIRFVDAIALTPAGKISRGPNVRR